jgi:hypothetical protein
MPEELPIACSLTAAELPVRLKHIEALGRDALLAAHSSGTRAELHFIAAPEIRERIERFAEAERRCCPFLSLEVVDSPDAVLLAVEAPPDAAGVLAELVAAFGETSARDERALGARGGPAVGRRDDDRDGGARAAAQARGERRGKP